MNETTEIVVGVTGVPPFNMRVFVACSLAASVDLGGSG